ncbi:MAG: hypothetical protein AAF944_04655 [Bacteroidota bacterium]
MAIAKKSTARKSVHTTIDAFLWDVELADFCKRHKKDKNEVIEQAVRLLIYEHPERIKSCNISI